MTGSPRSPTSLPALSDRAADAIPQFFISVVNHSGHSFTLSDCQASDGCGWVQEALPGQLLPPGGEQVWCGMPWDMDCAIHIALTLRSAPGGRIEIRLDRPSGLAAQLAVSLHALPELVADTQLQRAASASPFVMVSITARPASPQP